MDLQSQSKLISKFYNCSIWFDTEMRERVQTEYSLGKLFIPHISKIIYSKRMILSGMAYLYNVQVVEGVQSNQQKEQEKHNQNSKRIFYL